MSTRAQSWIAALACSALVCGLVACSFDQGAHPAACAAASDCEPGYRCYEHFCVPGGTGGTAAAGGTHAGSGGSTGGTSGTAGSAGNAGSGGAGADAGGADAGPTPSLDAAPPDAGGNPSIDGSLPDAGSVDSGPPLTLYTPCSNSTDCTGPGEECSSPVGGGFYCAPPCSTDGDCPKPQDGTATVACSSNGDCSLLCLGGATCPSALTCDAFLMLCH